MYNLKDATNQRYKAEVPRHDFKLFLAGIVVGIMSLMLVTVNALITMQNSQAELIESLNTTIVEYETQLKTIETEHQLEIDTLNQTIADKDEAYKKLTEDMQNESAVEIELIKKYSYVIDKVNPAEGFTLGMMYYVDLVAKEADINPHMVFAIFDIESDYDIDVKSTRSTATGLGQVLASTGKLIYEGVMGNPTGSYTHEMAENGYTNIEIVINYLKYLKENYSTINTMLSRYSGDQSGTYYGWYVDIMRQNGQDPAINHYI